MRRAHGLRWIAVLTLLLPAAALGQDQPPNPHEKNIAEINKRRAHVAVRQFFIALCIQQAKFDIARIANAPNDELAGELAIVGIYRIRKAKSALWRMESDGLEKMSDFERQNRQESEKLDDVMLENRRRLWRLVCKQENWLPGEGRRFLQSFLRDFSSQYSILRSEATDADLSSKALDELLSEEKKFAAEFERNRDN